MLPMQRVQIQFLLGELRSHMLCSEVKRFFFFQFLDTLKRYKDIHINKVCEDCSFKILHGKI